MNKTRMGRPPKGKRTQTERIHLRTESEEKAAYEQAAEIAGLGLSDWIRNRLNAAAKREIKRAALP